MDILTRSFIAVFVFIVQMFVPVHAGQTFCNASTEAIINPIKTVIVYGNGILNTRKQANRSLATLQLKFLSMFPIERYPEFDFKLAYNSSAGIIADMEETWRQKMESDNFDSLYWRMMSGLSAIPISLQDDYRERLASLDAWGPLETLDITTHLILYRELIGKGEKVVVVAHSQGNLFANKAYDVLHSGGDALTTNSFGIVAVATPASFVGGNGFYTTLKTDHLISSLNERSVGNHLAPPLPWNTENSPTGWDPEGHMFAGEYLLDGSVSESKILGDILYTNKLLEKFLASSNETAVSIMLTQDSGQNFDLQVSEPPVLLVTNSSPTGRSGAFDTIDTVGFGIEHYVVTCEHLVEGVYAISLVYAQGQGPGVAYLTVQAGATTQNYAIPVSTPTSAPASNIGFFPVGAVQVVRDPNSMNEGYIFNIAGNFREPGSPASAPPKSHYGAF